MIDYDPSIYVCMMPAYDSFTDPTCKLWDESTSTFLANRIPVFLAQVPLSTVEG